MNIEISTEKWSHLKTLSEIRQELKNTYNTFRDKCVVNKHTGIKIKFSRKGREKTYSVGLTLKKLAYVSVLDKLLREAKKGTWKEPKAKHLKSGIVGFLTFNVICVVDGKKTKLRLMVYVGKDGNFHYSINESIKKIKE